MPAETPMAFICDANVLIHYYLADKRILRMVVECIGPVYVPSPILENEVDQMDAKEAETLGLIVLVPEDAHIIQAGTYAGPRSLSRPDKLLLTLAKDKRLVCWTSDLPLKRQCEKDGIPTCWGLEMMLILCQRGHLSETEAIRVAEKLQKVDSAYITPRIIGEFERKLKDVNGGKI
jgi:predicted nucleic acid-binding protein